MDEEKQLVSFNGVQAEKENMRHAEEENMRHGVPLGFRFLPSDFVAFNDYLLPKVRGDNISTWFINDIDVYNYEPSHLPGLKYGEKTFYFTTRQLKYGHGKRSSRCANGGQGYWKMTSKFTEIQDIDGSILGKKNTLVYFIKNNNGKDFKTNYIMHEYVLDDSQIVHKINNVVLCSIYLRESAEEKKEAQARKESQQTTRDSNEEDVQQPQPPLMLKGKRPRVEEQPEPEPEPESQPQPQPQAYYQNKRFKQLMPWVTADEDIFVFGEPSHTLEPKTLEVSNCLFPEEPLLEEESQKQWLSQVFQELPQGPLLANVISQQPALIENTAFNEFAASMFSPLYMIESQNTYVGNIGCSTDQLPMISVRKEKNGLEMPLNLPTDYFLTSSEFFGSSTGATTTSLEEPFYIEEPLYNDDLNFSLEELNLLLSNGDKSLP